MKGRIGLAAALGAALMAVGASPASASSKRAGTITTGNSVVLLNTSGFVKVELLCQNSNAQIHVSALAKNGLDVWFDAAGVDPEVVHDHLDNGDGGGRVVNSPAHLEWSAAAGPKVALGQLYVAGTGLNLKDCLYTSQIS